MRFWTILAVFLTAALAAQDYYLSPEGDDAADGSSEHPWKTLAQANRTLKAGDRVTLSAGVYPGVIQPVRSGLPGKPIVYAAQTPGAAVISGGTTAIGGKRYFCGARINGRGFIELCGLAFRGKKAGIVLTSAGNIVCRDLSVTGPRPAIRTHSVRQCTFRKIAIDLKSLEDKAAKKVSLWRNAQAVGCRFADLRLTGGGTLFTLAGDSADCVIRTVEFNSDQGQAFAVEGTHHLLEKCRVRNAARPSEFSGTDSLLRGNFFTGNAPPDPLCLGGSDNCLYGNVFLNNGDRLPVIGAGPDAASLTADAEGRVLEVDHPEFFFDGNDIPGEPGDTLEIGSEKLPAVIVEIDREQKLLHLDRAIRAPAGSAVRPVFRP